MKTKLSALAVLLALAGFATTALANTNAEINKGELDQIHASCKEESKGAVNPEWYADECVADRVQALKEERGLAQPVKEES